MAYTRTGNVRLPHTDGRVRFRRRRTGGGGGSPKRMAKAALRPPADSQSKAAGAEVEDRMDLLLENQRKD